MNLCRCQMILCHLLLFFDYLSNTLWLLSNGPLPDLVKWFFAWACQIVLWMLSNDPLKLVKYPLTVANQILWFSLSNDSLTFLVKWPFDICQMSLCQLSIEPFIFVKWFFAACQRSVFDRRSDLSKGYLTRVRQPSKGYLSQIVKGLFDKSQTTIKGVSL